MNRHETVPNDDLGLRAYDLNSGDDDDLLPHRVEPSSDFSHGPPSLLYSCILGVVWHTLPGTIHHAFPPSPPGLCLVYAQPPLWHGRLPAPPLP